jgi:hypothetical protein
MPFSTALRAPLAAALLRLRHLMPGQHQPQPHRQTLVQLLQQMQAARGQREVLALAQLAALLPLGAQERTVLVAQTLKQLARVAPKPSPRSSASRAQTVRSIRSRQRRR